MIDVATSHVLRTMAKHGVQCLLAGGQACVVYGAAEFSKDVDFLVLADAENFVRIQRVARELDAETIAVPPFERRFLDEGLAIHLRCRSANVFGFRVDLMSQMRGVDSFPQLWERRTTLETDGLAVDVMNVRDLVCSKKTQRAKDWPMIQRLVEVHYLTRVGGEPSPHDIEFCLLEMRTPELIVELAERFGDHARSMSDQRALLESALTSDIAAVRAGIEEEIRLERERDRVYWAPLKKRLEVLRHEARQG